MNVDLQTTLMEMFVIPVLKIVNLVHLILHVLNVSMDTFSKMEHVSKTVHKDLSVEIAN